VLDSAFHGLKYLENLTLKLRKQILTDIDLVVLEEATGVVILCQLKHQELYGHDLHAKRVRGDRLKRQIKDWLGKLDKWIIDVGDSGIRKALRLPRDFPELVVYRMVISRHYSYPLKDVIVDRSVVYVNWVQFFNANELVKKDHPERSLKDIVSALKEVQNMPENQTHLPEPTTRWTINELNFVTSQKKPTTENSQKN